MLFKNNQAYALIVSHGKLLRISDTAAETLHRAGKVLAAQTLLRQRLLVGRRKTQRIRLIVRDQVVWVLLPVFLLRFLVTSVTVSPDLSLAGLLLAFFESLVGP